MTDLQALLAAVLANPDEDTPRLMLADCLEEAGERDRAEFVRVQIAKVRDPDFHGFLCLPERPCKNCRREYDLWRSRGVDFGAGLPRADEAPNNKPGCVLVAGLGVAVDYTFRRGWVESVTCSAADWLAHADAILARHPVTAVTLTTPLEIFRDEVVRGLREIDFGTGRLYHTPINRLSLGETLTFLWRRIRKWTLHDGTVIEIQCPADAPAPR